MAIWIGLIVAPVLALTDLVLSYAAVGWACAHQAVFAVHMLHALFLASTSACAITVFRARHEDLSVAFAPERRTLLPFLAGLGTASSALSVLAVIAMWIPTWLIATCLA